VLIPRAPGFWLLFLATMMVNVGGAVFNSAGYALIPDITPPPLRSRANGIINVMGGLGALIAFFVLSGLYRRSRTLPFDLAAIGIVASLAVILLAVRERRVSLLYRAASDPVAVGRMLPAMRAAAHRPDRTIVLLMFGALAWVAAVNGVQNMFTRYGIHHLGLDPSGATFLLGFFALAFIAFAVPAGIIGDRIGRLWAIRLGLAGVLAVFVAVSSMRDPILYRVALGAGGACWSLVTVNAYPLLMDYVPAQQAGAYTGLYGAVVALAGLIAPPLYGLVVDTWGFGVFFVPGVIFLALGLLCALRMQSGARPRSGGTRRPAGLVS
jgi:maltose/moltooligosaccharide transporter